MIEAQQTPAKSEPAQAIEYWVQCSKQPSAKSGYRIRATCRSESQAWMFYNALNIGNGYKKRLVSYAPLSGAKRVIARDVS